MHELPFIAAPFVLAFLQMASAALGLGLILALWEIGRRRQWLMLTRWALFFVFVLGAAVYGLPKLLAMWRTYVGESGFKKGSMYFAYFVGLFAAFFIMPEPRRIALNRLRAERRRMPRHGYDAD